MTVGTGAAIAVPGTLAAGSDVTLLVYNNPASPTVSRIAADTACRATARPRCAPSTASPAAPQTLTANGTLVAGVASGTAVVTWASITPTTNNVALKRWSSTNSNLANDASNVPNANTVNTVNTVLVGDGPVLFRTTR